MEYRLYGSLILFPVSTGLLIAWDRSMTEFVITCTLILSGLLVSLIAVHLWKGRSSIVVAVIGLTLLGCTFGWLDARPSDRIGAITTTTGYVALCWLILPLGGNRRKVDADSGKDA